MKKLLIVGAGELQIPLIKSCRNINDEGGVFVLATDRNPNAAGFDYVDDYRVIDSLDKESIYQYAKESNIDGIVATSEVGLFAVSYVCEKMNLPGVSDFAAKISNNKYFMREVMKKNGMKVPFYYCIRNINELSKIVNEISFPVVVKPTSSSGSIGVVFVKSKEELEQACKSTFDKCNNSEIIFEEYLVGKEYSVETLSQNGEHHIIAITEKYLNDLPYFVEQRHVIPANIANDESKQINKCVSDFLSICDIRNSASHTELRITENGPVIIETGARIGGDQIAADLVPLATGVSMHENIARIALGLRLNIDNRIEKYAGIQFIMNENYEKVKSKIDYLKTKKEIVRINLKNNYEINNGLLTTSSLERRGYYLAVANTREELLNILDIK